MEALDELQTLDDLQTLADLTAVRAAAFNRLGPCAVALDTHGVIIDANESWRLFARLNDGDVATTGRGVNYLDVCERAAAAGAEGAAEAAGGLQKILNGRADRFDLEYPCPSPIEDRWFLLQASSAPISEGCGAVLLHVDITTRKLLTDQLTAFAEVDELTGLPNRRFAVRQISTAIAAAAQSHAPVWVLFVDLDGFKAINDLHGHHVGDELLAKVGVRARRVLREQDHVCRLGGDEFVVICPGLGETSALKLARRLRTVMAAPFQIGDLDITGGVSIGIAASTPDSTVETLLGAADKAMYVDKREVARR